MDFKILYALKDKIRYDKVEKITQLKLMNDDLINWLKMSGEKNEDGSYKYPDHSGIILIIGMRRSGKGVLSWKIIDLIKKYDPEKSIMIYGATQQYIDYLKSIGFKNSMSFNNFEDMVNNSIVFIDEGIINTNAKEALTKRARSFEKVLAVLSHKRIIMIVTTQTFGLFKQLTLQSNIIIYKQLSTILLNRERNDKFLSNFKHLLEKLNRNTAIIEMTIPGYKSGVGRLKLGDPPSWYTSILSESFKDVDLDFEAHKLADRRMRIKQVAKELYKDGIIPDAKDKTKLYAIRGYIRDKYFDDKFTNQEISQILEYIFSIMYKYVEDKDINNNNQEDNDENEDEDNIKNKFVDITDKELEIAELFASGKTSHDFNDMGYNARNVMKAIRNSLNFLFRIYKTKSESDKEGNKYERLIANFFIETGDYCMRALASGGKRGEHSSDPDMIHFTKDGEIRLVQIKVRNRTVDHFAPYDLASEYDLEEYLKRLGFECSSWLYYHVKGNDISNIFMIKLDPKNRNKTLKVDYSLRQYWYIDYTGEKNIEINDISILNYSNDIN